MINNINEDGYEEEKLENSTGWEWEGNEIS